MCFCTESAWTFLCIAFIGAAAAAARFFLVSFHFFTFLFNFGCFFFGNFSAGNKQHEHRHRHRATVANGNGNKPYSLALKLLLFTWGERNNNKDACAVCISDMRDWNGACHILLLWQTEKECRVQQIEEDNDDNDKDEEMWRFIVAELKFEQKNVKF